MPIILEDNAPQGAAAAGGTVVKTGPDYSPKDYNSILTGNGIGQGLLRSTLTAAGSDPVSQTALATIMADRHECTNRAHHVHDDVKSYTTLQQDVSLLGGYSQFTHNPPSQASVPMPVDLMTDHFMTFEDPAGDFRVFRSRLFLNRVYVYKSSVNYAVCAYTLIVADEAAASGGYIEHYDSIYAVSKLQDPITEMYARIAERVKTDMSRAGWKLVTDDAAAQAGADKSTSLYDLIMSELEIIKTPGKLRYALERCSAAGFEVLRYANNILNLVNIPFNLYQSDVIDVVNARKREESVQLKNANMSLSLADTLSSMQGQLSAQIPELVGKRYTTQQTVLTTEQTAAIESPSLVTIVAAGAGTGKSTCIMHRLSFMEENGCDMKQTFVLSFTKAAAGHIKKNFKDCKSSTIAEFTHNFVNVILDDGSGTRVDIIAHSDFAQKFRIQVDDLENAGILPPDTLKALKEFRSYVEAIDRSQAQLLNMLDITLHPQANNILSVLRMMHCTSLELDPIIFHTQLGMLKPNIEHIVVDESQDSNRLEFLTMLKMAMMHNISIYIVGDCAQTLYEFRDADPRILNNLTKLFNTYDLSINHRSTQIILDVANLMSSTMNTYTTALRANQIMQITRQAVDDTVTMNTYQKANDPATLKILDDWLEVRLGKGQSIAVIARSGNDVQKLYDYLSARYGAQYTVQNITSQRRNDITILSAIGAGLAKLFPMPGTMVQATVNGQAAQVPCPGVPGWPEFERAIRDENIRLNSMQRGGNRYSQNGPTVNKVTLDWLAERQADGPNILAALNDPATHDAEIRKLQMSLLDAQTEKNNLLQRVMDAKNAKLKEQKADIVVCTVHGVKGLEYDHVACFINTESGRSGSGNSDENKRIGYVALTRAKLSECVFCTREKLLKDFEAYRAAQP